MYSICSNYRTINTQDCTVLAVALSMTQIYADAVCANPSRVVLLNFGVFLLQLVRSDE